MEILCSRCGTVLQCKPEGGCWCMELPPALAIPTDAEVGCLCRDCLMQDIESKARRD